MSRAFSSNLKGKVRNFHLPKNRPLVPLYEAIVNSINAIDERKQLEEFDGQIECQTAHYGRRFPRIIFGVFAYPIVPRDFRLHVIIGGTARYRSLISAA